MRNSYSGARGSFRSMHQFYRRRLNAGGKLQLSNPQAGGGTAEQVRAHVAAFAVVVASGRQPAPVFRHWLHWPHAYRSDSNHGTYRRNI